MIEKEFKTLISESKYHELLSQFHWNKVIDQTNHYFSDSDEILQDKNITVRVREINGTYTLQIKSPINEDKALHINEEFEEKLTMLPNIICSKQFMNIANLFIGDAYLIGSLQTNRYVCQWNETTQICLDKNTYLRFTDYELEIEYINYISHELMDSLVNVGVSFEHKIEGKYSRFMKRRESIE